VISDGPAADTIDVHGHCVPQAFLDEVVRSQPFGVQAEEADGKYLVTFPGRPQLRPVTGTMLDTKDRAGWLAAQRVFHQVVAPWLDIDGQGLPTADGARWVQLLNDALAESVADGARGLSAHATLHLANPEHAADELRRAVTELGMHSAMLPTFVSGGAPLSDRRFDSVWAAAVDLGVPIVLHPPTQAPVSALLAQYPALRNMFGRQIDSTLTTADMVLAGVFDRYPALRLVLVHGGGFLPYQAARFDQDARLGAGPRRTPSEIIRSLYYDSVLISAASLRFLFDFAGPERVLIGSDFGAPNVQGGVSLTAAAREASHDAATLRAILAGTALQLFRLQERSGQ
jgi:aminocarboxymuconate-semialdehyde decarboxylase